MRDADCGAFAAGFGLESSICGIAETGAGPLTHTGKAEINETMQRFDVFFYRSLKMYSTNIFINLVAGNFMFVVLRLNRGGVITSKLVV